MMHGPVLLTGGSGFLGSHIADRLVASGLEVRALVRPGSDVRHLASLPGITLVHGSLEDPASLAAAARGAHGVIHAAGLVKARRPRDFGRVNALGTGHLLEAARTAGTGSTRFVHVSSLTALGPSGDGRPRPPGATAEPVTAYGRSKLAAEERVRGAAGDLHTVVVRPPVVHGPRDRETLAFFQAVKLGILPLTGSPRSVLSMVYATDCADACVRALDADVASGSAFDVEDGRPETLETIVGHIEAALGTRVRIRIPIPGPALTLAALATETWGRALGRPVMLTRDKVRELRAPHWVCDGAAARAALGWTPRVTFAEGARRSAAWYREAGWL
ncbi:MAG TPA: NAD(P)-dependent oxidoreductase [Longimicrobiales bacterium]|nr:NAD(P)-dependent oxidoreductase [Longimicrobiales bacterium]